MTVTHKNEAERMQTLQHRLQFNPPALLGSIVMGNKSYLIRQLQPWQDKVDLTVCKSYKNWTEVLHSMAQLIAFAHLRGTGRQGSSTADELIAFASGANWKKEVLSLSDKMAKNVFAEYKLFVKSTA